MYKDILTMFTKTYLDLFKGKLGKKKLKWKNVDYGYNVYEIFQKSSYKVLINNKNTLQENKFM